MGAHVVGSGEKQRAEKGFDKRKRDIFLGKENASGIGGGRNQTS